MQRQTSRACRLCGEPFTIDPHRVGPPVQFCSDTCRAAAHAEREHQRRAEVARRREEARASAFASALDELLDRRERARSTALRTLIDAADSLALTARLAA